MRSGCESVTGIETEVDQWCDQGHRPLSELVLRWSDRGLAAEPLFPRPELPATDYTKSTAYAYWATAPAFCQAQGAGFSEYPR